MSSKIEIGELVKYALLEARSIYNINLTKYMQIIDSLSESKIQISTFNDFCNYYDMLLMKISQHLTIQEYNVLLNNKGTLCAMVLEVFNKLV